MNKVIIIPIILILCLLSSIVVAVDDCGSQTITIIGASNDIKSSLRTSYGEYLQQKCPQSKIFIEAEAGKSPSYQRENLLPKALVHKPTVLILNPSANGIGQLEVYKANVIAMALEAKKSNSNLKVVILSISPHKDYDYGGGAKWSQTIQDKIDSFNTALLTTNLGIGPSIDVVIDTSKILSASTDKDKCGFCRSDGGHWTQVGQARVAEQIFFQVFKSASPPVLPDGKEFIAKGNSPAVQTPSGTSVTAVQLIPFSGSQKEREIDEVWHRISSFVGLHVDQVYHNGLWVLYESVYGSPQPVSPELPVSETTTPPPPSTTSISLDPKITTTDGKSVSCLASEGTLEMRALLDTIAWAEGTTHAYNIMFGGKKFTDYTDHPANLAVEMPAKGFPFGKTTSTAAGRYQFLKGTYNDLVNKGYFTQGFISQEQDKAGLYLVTTKRSVDQEALDLAIKTNTWTPIWDKLALEWASLPHSSKDGRSYYGQGGRSYDDLNDVFKSCYNYHKSTVGLARPSAGLTQPQRLCSSLSECKHICQNRASWPALIKSKGGVSLDNAVVVPEILGLINRGSGDNEIKNKYGLTRDNLPPTVILPQLLPPLQKAGQLAAQQGYQLQTWGGLRTVEHQLELACPMILDGTFNPAIIAWPGGSNHGAGTAIDLALLKEDVIISGTTTENQNNPQYTEGNKILAQIMYQAGWKRLKSEVWHFEYTSGSVESTRTTICYTAPPCITALAKASSIPPSPSSSTTTATSSVKTSAQTPLPSTLPTTAATSTLPPNSITVTMWDNALNAVGITGKSWIGKMASNGADDNFNLPSKGRETIIFAPSTTDFSKSVELIYYFHGISGFASWDMRERIAPQAKKMADAGRNIVIVFPELSWSRGGARSSLSHYKDYPAWNNKDSNLVQFHKDVQEIIKTQLAAGSLIPGSITLVGHSNGGYALKQAALSGALETIKPDRITFSDADYVWSSATYTFADGKTGSSSLSALDAVWENYLKNHNKVELNILVKNPSSNDLTSGGKPADYTPTNQANNFLKKLQPNFNPHFSLRINNINYIPYQEVDPLIASVIDDPNRSKNEPLHHAIARLSLAYTAPLQAVT